MAVALNGDEVVQIFGLMLLVIEQTCVSKGYQFIWYSQILKYTESKYKILM